MMTTLVTALGPNDPDDGDIGRQQRGLAIAALTPIRNDGFGWKVPSQSRNGSYFVSLEGQGQREPYCSCPDFEERRQPCKHVYAVQVIVQREARWDDGGIELTETKRVRISQPWAAYNDAQENEGKLFEVLLRELCDTVPELPRVTGRPRHPLGDMIYAMGTKVYSMRSARRAKSVIRSAVEEGLMGVEPSTSATIRMFGRADVTPVLEGLIQTSALPLRDIEQDFAIDSTGFAAASYQRWYDHKWGTAKKKVAWVKLHAMCGVTTNIVTVASADAAFSADSPHLPDFVRATSENFRIRQVSADMAYSARSNLRAVAEAGGTPFIPFKTRSRAFPAGSKHHDPLWNQMYSLFTTNQREFAAHYHKRSNIETVFHMVKAKFGDKVRSKTKAAQVNEVLLKVLCHNIAVLASAMYAMQVAPTFGQERG